MGWLISEDALGPKDPDVRSTIFCVGNGRICTRGTLSEEGLGAFRGVYVSGLYTRSPWGIDYFMGAPDWLPAAVLIGGAAPACAESSRTLDMRDGILRRRAVFEHGGTAVEALEERLASFANPRIMAQRFTLRRLRGNADVEVRMALDGDIRQSRAKYYSADQYPSCDRHGIRLSEVEEVAAAGEQLRVTLLSRQTGRRACARAVARRIAGGGPPGRPLAEARAASVTWTLAGSDGESRFEKLAVITADLGETERALGDGENDWRLVRGASYEQVERDHVAAVRRFWDVADVEIDGDDESQRAVRYAVWTTRISAPLDNGYSSIGAKNLTGDWYRGGVFWDMEIYQLPMLAAVAPALARNHVLYRCNRLDASRCLAAQDGYRGARFAGTSYNSGLENPPGLGGLSLMEIHTSFEVAWGIRHYYAMTRDADLMLKRKGLETVLEVANFWSSKVARDPDGSFHLRSICGPDELHKPVDDNAYTNLMIVELLRASRLMIEHFRALDAHAVDEILKRIRIDEPLLAHWLAVESGLRVAMADGLVFDQFRGHAALPEPNPRLLKEAGMGADKIAKQADTLMLFQNIPWDFPEEQTAANYAAFASLCNQTSSLSLCSHALVAAQLGYDRDAWHYFRWARGVDLDDSMGNAAHGVHGAGEGGIWVAVVWGFGGLRVWPDGIRLAPRLPARWDRLAYKFLAGGTPVSVRIERDRFTVTNLGHASVSLTIGGEVCAIAGGASREFENRVAWRVQGLEGVVLDVGALGPQAGAGAALCQALRAAGIRCAGYAAADGVDALASAAGLAGSLDASVDNASLRAAKPDPQGFLTATQRLRVLPWNSVGIAFDDAGEEAVRRAGMVCVRVGTAGAHADLAVESLAEVTVERLRRALVETEIRVNPYLERNIAIVKSEAKAG